MSKQGHTIGLFSATRGQAVHTPDGKGVILSFEMRRPSNGGAGTRQARVQLEDGRVRHYSLPGLASPRK